MQIVALSKVKSKAPPTVPSSFPHNEPSLNSFMGLENFSCAIFDYCHFAIYHLARMFAAHPPLFECLPPALSGYSCLEKF